MSGLKQSTDFDEVFTFWEDLPMMKMIDEEEYRLIDAHEYREAIVQILRRGIFDENVQKQRHALSMKEILVEVAKTLDRKKIPKSTLYHHRDILEEAGLIQEVVTILEGKRYVTYYGRTARAFLSGRLTQNKQKNQVKYLQEVLKAFNPELPDEKIEHLAIAETQRGAERFDAAKDWLEKHEETLRTNDLDAINLFQLVLEYFPLSDEDLENRNIMQEYLNLNSD